LTDPNVETVSLRVEATAGTNAHTIFGEDHKCSINKRTVAVKNDEVEGRKQN
jgi:hypothetical protein